MHRTTLLLALTLGLAACRGDDSDTGGEDDSTSDGATADDPCGECPQGGYAVDCGYLWGIGEDTVCGINKDNAEYLCLSMWAGVIKSSPSDNCPSPDMPWDPAPLIYRDPSGSGLRIIELELLERIEDRPRDIYLDQTRLDWNEAGEVFVSTSGQLASALGLPAGDILIDVNGYSFAEILDTVRLYTTLRAADTLELNLRRSGENMALIYRIE